MSELSFISDQQLLSILDSIYVSLEKAKFRIEKDLSSTVIDPFSLAIENAYLGGTMDDWKASEKRRQLNKALCNGYYILCI